MKILTGTVFALFLLATAPAAHADAVTDKIAELQKQWEQVKYATAPKDAQVAAAAKLSAEAAKAAAEWPDRAEPKIWYAISLATEASFNRSLASLPKVKQAKALLEQAIAIDGTALDGAAYTYLGSLYAQVPGWPIAFGDSEKAQQAFQKALKISPDDIDANYFLGEYLLRRKKPEAAMTVLQKALGAPDRPGRMLADKGRRDEIRTLIAEAGMKTAETPHARVNN